eukprot:TRINITY_DN12335_c0_g1_i8.p1 TRINITY_DN12335_c0_g1~~TRINITY_DN12335_c0_g1_i8.p1  ORF type:complete len:242 (-),score=33.22 TRINITY_DN12335_c0_g1_i8:138-863(-)
MPPGPVADKSGQANTMPSNRFFGNLISFMAGPSSRWVFLVGLLYGIIMSFFNSLLFLHMKRNLQSRNSEIGTFLTISVLLEIPIFGYSDFFIKKFGYKKMILLAQSTSLVRLLFYYLFCSSKGEEGGDLMMMVLQGVHGVCYAFFWASVVQTLNYLSPPSIKASVQSVFSTVYSHIGQGIGVTVFGYVMDHHGSPMMWLLGGLLTGFTILITLIFFPEIPSSPPHKTTNTGKNGEETSFPK